MLQLLSGGEASIESLISSFDKVDHSSFAKVHRTVLSQTGCYLHDPYLQAAAEVMRAKPTYVAIGDVNGLPFADELGL